MYVMRQASRRSWRIGQTRPVKVVFMSYRNTLQADALKLVAKKLQSSLAVEGELPEDGLAAYGDDGDDLMMALARRSSAARKDADGETVEAVFAQARDAEPAPRSSWWTTAGRQWQSSRRPSRSTVTESTATDTMPTATGSTSSGRRSSWRWATTRPPTGTGKRWPRLRPGQRPRPRRGTPEGQQSLFSWAEFMAEEPVKPKGRSRKPQPAAASLFEWALTLEQERRKEPVGAGR